MKKAVLLIPVLLLIAACATREICDADNQSEMVARFKIAGTEPPADTVLSSVTVHGIRPGQPDSLIYRDVPAARLVLPLNPNEVYSSFVIEADGRRDTLRIGHRTEYYLISYTCGFAALFTLETLDHTGGAIRKTEVINGVVDAKLEQDEEHIWLYF